jgi:hypothetical protein
MEGLKAKGGNESAMGRADKLMGRSTVMG